MVIKFAVLGLFALLALAPLALAHEEATGVVKERMDLMDTQKEAMKIIGDMAKGAVPFDAAKAAEAARDIEVTAKEIPDLFPEGTDGHPSEAKPEIWTDWDKFTGDSDKLAAAAGDLVAVLEAGADEWRDRFKVVVDACKACHKSFRAEKDKDHAGH
jgi:cytochrome c556